MALSISYNDCHRHLYSFKGRTNRCISHSYFSGSLNDSIRKSRLGGRLTVDFLFFHSDFPVNRWAGAYLVASLFLPLFVVCGCLDSFKVRMTATVTAATLYPPMILMFGAEGIHTWTYFLKEPRDQWWRRVRGYGIQMGICASLLFANSLREHGPISYIRRSNEEPRL